MRAMKPQLEAVLLFLLIFMAPLSNCEAIVYLNKKIATFIKDFYALGTGISILYTLSLICITILLIRYFHFHWNNETKAQIINLSKIQKFVKLILLPNILYKWLILHQSLCY